MISELKMDIPLVIKLQYLETRLASALKFVTKLRNELAILDQGKINSHTGEILSIFFLCEDCGCQFKTLKLIRNHLCVVKLQNLKL